MATKFTRREVAKLAGTGALMLSTTAIELTTSATRATAQAAGGDIPELPAARGEGATTGDPSAAMQRADDLLRQMTVEEKAMQLSSVFPLALFNSGGTNHSQLDALLKNGIGHVSAPGLIGHKTPEQLAKSVNAIQRYLVMRPGSRSRRSSTTRR